MASRTCLGVRFPHQFGHRCFPVSKHLALDSGRFVPRPPVPRQRLCTGRRASLELLPVSGPQRDGTFGSSPKSVRLLRSFISFLSDVDSDIDSDVDSDGAFSLSQAIDLHRRLEWRALHKGTGVQKWLVRVEPGCSAATANPSNIFLLFRSSICQGRTDVPTWLQRRRREHLLPRTRRRV